MKLQKLAFSSLIFLICLSIHSSVDGDIEGSVPIRLVSNTESIALGKDFTILEDIEGKLTFNDVKSSKYVSAFKKAEQEIPNLGVTKSVIWIHFKLLDKGNDDQRDWFLEFGHPLVDQLDLYYEKIDDVYIHFRTGDILPFESREMNHRKFIFRISTFPNKTHSVYVRLQSKGALMIPLHLWSDAAFIENSHRHSLMAGFYFGLCFALILYNLFLFVSVGDRLFLYLALATGGFASMLFFLDGYAFQYIWPTVPKLNDYYLISAPVSSMFGLLFVKSCITSKRLSVSEDDRSELTAAFSRFSFESRISVKNVLSGVIYLNVFIIIAFIFLPYGVRSDIITDFFPFMIIIAPVAGFLRLRKSSIAARFFLVGFCIHIIGWTLFMLNMGGRIPVNAYTYYAGHVGSAVGLILISLGLGNKINEERKAKLDARKKAVSYFQKINRLKTESLVKIQKVEKDLRESEAKFREMSALLPQSIFELDANLNITYTNQCGLDVTGYSEAQLESGLNALDLIYHTEKQLVKDLLQDQIKGRNTNVYDYAIKSNTSGRVPMLFYFSPIMKDEKAVGLRGVGVDITERKRTEKELKKAKRAAEKANENKSELLSDISHEVRNPLHGIMGYARLGIKETNKINQIKLKDYFSTMLASGERILNLINSLLDLAKLEAGKAHYLYEKAPISNVIETIVKEQGALVQEKKIKLSFMNPGFNDTLLMDREKIMQVVRNLLNNAIKFSPEFSTITVNLVERNENVLVTIADEGIGIPPDKLDYVFNKFTQIKDVDKAKNGTGLGLAICQKIISDHQGEIWAENSSSGGAVFSFYLPIFAERTLVT